MVKLIIPCKFYKADTLIPLLFVVVLDYAMITVVGE